MINKHTLALIDTVMMMIGKLVKWLSHDRRAKPRKRILLLWWEGRRNKRRRRDHGQGAARA